MAFYPVGAGLYSPTCLLNFVWMIVSFMSNPILHAKPTFSFATEHATTLGLDAAILLQFVTELWSLRTFSGTSEALAAPADVWLNRLPFFSPARFKLALETLHDTGLVWVSEVQDNICIEVPGETKARRYEPTPETVDNLPATAPIHRPAKTTDRAAIDHAAATNPARLLNQSGDALWAQLSQTDQQPDHEAANSKPRSDASEPRTTTATRKRQRVTSQWQPSDQCADMVKSRGIEWAFAMAQREAFVLYYMDSGQMSTSWDSKFLDWVNRRWQYHLNDRQHGNQTHAPNAPTKNDSSERAPRERKQQLRQKLRDIGDLDW